MRFAAWGWLFGTGVALGVALLLVVSGVLLLRALRRFGDDDRMATLVTARSGGRRAVKGVLLVLALALAFLAAAQPQYGRGTRRIPATNLDVVVVLDFSKSMYARDVTPSRIERAKSEVTDLMQELPGARFGAVAFAGEPMGYPLSSDSGAIAQFLRQLSPHDMPVGGTAIARALTAAHEVLSRDRLATKTKQVVLLITDGEDLEGNPVAVAQTLAADGITVHVVQIGGRTPEPIPDIDEQGDMVGWRTDAAGQPLTTALSAEGEATLAKIAETTGGVVVQSAQGTTGIRDIARRMRILMTEELSEKVETVYADVFHYPLALALVLLLIETFVAQARVTRLPPPGPPPKARAKRRPKKKKGGPDARRTVLATLLGLTAAGVGVQAVGCEAVDSVFVRHAPEVDEALTALDAGDAAVAVDLLEQYLGTGKCEAGEIGAPDRVRERPQAAFDLGAGLFLLAEHYGQRFGEEDGKASSPGDPKAEAERAAGIRCALRIVRAVTADRAVARELRARAHYLAGNLEFLRANYRDAVTEYDLALRLIPGLPDGSVDDTGTNAAWNRAIALRRLEEQEKDAGADADASPDAPPDASDGADDGSDGSDDGGQDADAEPDGGAPDAEPDGGAPDAGPDGGPEAGDAGADANDTGDRQDAGDEGSASQPPNKPDQGEEQAPPEQGTASQDDRVLDDLEQAPTFQQHTARGRVDQGGVRPRMEDK